MSSSPHTKSHHLRQHTTSFINAFIANNPPTEILDKYFTPDASITEHGPLCARERLPFLATTFSGRRPQNNSHESSKTQPSESAVVEDTLDDYYTLLTQTLKFLPQSDTLPPESSYVIDERTNKVVVKLKGKFESIKTGKGWAEEFVYIIKMRNTGADRDWKIETLELWADPLSAWIACGEQPL